MIVINDTLGVYGGSQTLILRMCQWLSKNNIKSAVLCRSDANTEIVQKLKKCGTRVICLDIRDFSKTEKLLREFQAHEEIRVVNFIWNYYLDMELLKKVSGLRFSNIVYAIHPDTFKKGKAFGNRFLQSYAIRSYAKIFKRMNKNRSVYSMDEDVLLETKKYLQIPVDPSPTIWPLPIFCEEKPHAEQIIEDGFAGQTIMTAARAEFPYKGYLLGLIDDYSWLKTRYPALKLEVVTGGLEEDVAKLHEKIDALPEIARRDIVFHNWMDYDALKLEMEQCKVFIGMGTTVLEAALAYKPSIAVRYNVYEVLADCLVSECPNSVVASRNCQSPARSLLESVIQMSFEEYRKECYSSFRQTKNVYDIDKIMNAMIHAEPVDNGCILTRVEVLRHGANNWVNQILHREKAVFDFKSIKVE